MVRGEIFRLRDRRRARGHEQSGTRYCVVAQADELLYLSTVLVCPTSSAAAPATFRPEIEIAGVRTRVLVEQALAVDARHLTESAGRLEVAELLALDGALSLVLGL